MKHLFYFAIIFTSLANFAFATTDSCGDDSTDRAYPTLNWEQAATYKVNTSFVDISAIVCVGIDYSNLEIKRLHYRDNTGMKRNYSMSQLKNQDIALLKRSDFPAAARIVTRNVNPLTIRVVSDTFSSNKRNYSLSFKFVRNMARGWSATDTRELLVYGIVRNSATSPIEIFYKDKYGKTSFDALNLNLSGSLKIDTIDLSENSRRVKTIKTENLKKVQRK
jgi:hypothetical protein